MILGALALLLVALVFVAAELFVPSHGLLAVLAGIAALASVMMAYQVSAGLAMIFALIIAISIPIVFYWAVRIYPRTPVGKRVILENPTGKAATPFTMEASRLTELVRQQGVAVTMLRPSGSIEINGQRIDAMSESEVIPPGARVQVLRVSGLKVFVKSLDGQKNMSAYIIALVDVTDAEQYAKYAQKTPATIARYGGKFIVRGGKTETLEGPIHSGRIVVIEFSTYDAALEFYHSAEYTEAKLIRQSAADASFLLVEGA